MAASSSAVRPTASPETLKQMLNQLDWLLKEMPDECAEKKALAKRVHRLSSEHDVHKVQATADEILRDYRNALPKEERLALWKQLPGGAAYLEKHSIICELTAALVRAAFSEWLDLNQKALSSVTTLDLSGRELRYVPPEISRLESLMILSLDDNQLTLFPLALTKLSLLTTLYIGQNQISRLPPEVGRLKNLCWLDLSENDLLSLPKEIGEMTYLNKLELTGNRLTDLPFEVGRLRNLQHLHLENNQLELLPQTIFELDLDHVELEGNPLPKHFTSKIHNAKTLKALLKTIEKTGGIKLRPIYRK